jgi:hypothetical protein
MVYRHSLMRELSGGIAIILGAVRHPQMDEAQKTNLEMRGDKMDETQQTTRRSLIRGRT